MDESFLHAPPERVAQWRNLKFGMFIHWGPVCLTGKEISWSRAGERRGHRSRFAKRGTPVEVYDNLFKKFNPTKFDADEWVSTAKSAGMKYMVFTSKHHDGFCMFDSKLTDYKITNPLSPYRKDIVKQLADACHRAKLWFGIYYSPPDWHHPDFRNGARHALYIKYLHGQIRELLTNYGRVDILWFDGLGGSAQDWDSVNLFKMVRSLQPEILINNRGGLPGDFDTPEQRIGRMRTDRPWETCMTIGTQWAWKPNDRVKTLKQIVDVLVNVVGGDGNLLLNVGPMPDGRIEPRQVERLRGLGTWLKKTGPAIYGTRGGPFRRSYWGAATCKGNTMFLHLLDKSVDRIVLPGIDRRILAARSLSGVPMKFEQSENKIIVDVVKGVGDSLDTIIELKLDGPALTARVGKIASGSLLCGKRATASNVYRRMYSRYGPRMAVDDNPDTRWATDSGTHQAWLQVDLDGKHTVSRIFVSEACGSRVRKFEILAKKPDGKWVKVLDGARIGENASFSFPPIDATAVKLNILRAVEGPTIWEFRAFGPPPRASQRSGTGSHLDE